MSKNKIPSPPPPNPNTPPRKLTREEIKEEAKEARRALMQERCIAETKELFFALESEIEDYKWDVLYQKAMSLRHNNIPETTEEKEQAILEFEALKKFKPF